MSTVESLYAQNNYSHLSGIYWYISQMWCSEVLCEFVNKISVVRRNVSFVENWMYLMKSFE